jgi:hypothetical protein
MAEPKEAKKVNILNLSKVGRVFILNDGRKLEPEHSLPVVAEEAAFLLGVLPKRGPRYPELVDADKFSPLSAKAKDAVEENERLLKENAELKAMLETGTMPEEKKGGRK